MYFMIVVSTGYAAKYLIDNIIYPDASQIADSNFQKKLTISKNYVGEGVYKNEAEIQDEFSKLKTLSPELLTSSLLFQKDKTFFLQVAPDRKLVPNHFDEMHPHYYWLKKAVR